MKLYEFQAKGLLKAYNIPTESYALCNSVDEVVNYVETTPYNEVILKSQVLTGGRFKKGGILFSNREDLSIKSKALLSKKIDDEQVRSLLVSEVISIDKEFYLSFIVEAKLKTIVLIVSPVGGIDIESLAIERPNLVYRIPIDPFVGVPDFFAREAAFKLTTNMVIVNQLVPIIKQMYLLLIEKSANLVEINPLVVTHDKKVLAVDAKMTIDDNSVYKHPIFIEMSNFNPTPAEIKEKRAATKGISYVELEGNIGCMVNGAGLAMATNDLIDQYGGASANFLDIGGSSNSQKAVDALDILLEDPKVKVVLISIFGGITRCDDVAKGLLQAISLGVINQPLIVRLTGTNEKEARELLKGERVTIAHSMDEAVKLAVLAATALESGNN